MTSQPGNRKELLHAVLRLAEQAGVETMRFYQGRTAVTQKSDSSPLTDADRASHDFLMRSLPGLIPGVPVISEEAVDPTQGPANADGLFWLVDPLDGTKEFLKGTGEFTVNIALIEHRRAVAGVVHAPVTGITYFADLKNGAFRKQRNEAPACIRVQRADRERLRIVASKDHAGPLVATMLAGLNNVELKSMGSSLKFCLVAEGSADVYLRDVPTMEWDTAAAQCIVQTAGGGVFTLDGHPLRYCKPGLKNPAIITIGDHTLPWATLLDKGLLAEHTSTRSAAH